jgi:hypothetical protein
MANQLVEAMKIGEEKARQEMQIAEDAYNEQWRDQVDWGPQDPEPGEPVFGTEEGGQGFFEFVKSLQISPKDIQMALEMWPNLKPLGINVPKDPKDPTGHDNPYSENPTPGHPLWQISHGKHQEPTGWSQPTGTHPGSEHKMPGNSGEYYYNPMDGSDIMPWEQRPKDVPELADAKALTDYLDSKGRSQRTGSFRDTPIKGQDLIDALKIGKQLLEQA